MNRLNSPLLTDLYHLNMIQAYLDHGDTETAVFEFFVRKFPAKRGFLMAAGLEQALDFLENLRFSAEEVDWLACTRRFDQQLLDQFATFRFTGVPWRSTFWAYCGTRTPPRTPPRELIRLPPSPARRDLMALAETKEDAS